MRRWTYFGVMTLVLALFSACGSNNGDEAWIRSEPVDVNAVDENQDGFVYQDPMDWNVIADEEGTCPKCNMLLVKVSVDEAVNNLKANGYKVK